MVADEGDHQVIAVADEGGAYVEAGADFEAAGLELAQAETAVDVRAAKRGGQVAQLGQEVSAGVCGQGGDLGGGAARLQNFHREKPA